jgi:hypothetical protein
MKEVYGNAWNLFFNDFFEFDTLCITTNGTIKKNGCAVLGRGIAKELTLRYPDASKILGHKLAVNGNNVHFLLSVINHCTGKEHIILSFPVKHNWWEEADIELIKRSCNQLMNCLPSNAKCLLPRPGCGNGKLKWEDVKPEIELLLDDRVHIVTYKKGL